MYQTWMRFFSPGPAHHRLGLVCLGVGLQHGPLPTVGPRTLDHHVAVVISSGGGWYRGADGRRTPVTAPALLWLTPGVPHHYAPDPDTGWDEGFVDFAGPATTTYTELGYIEPDRPVVPLSDASGPRRVVARIARAARRGNPLLEVETGAAVHELLVALRRARADLAPDGDQVLEALARDACLPLSVAGHAARHGMTTAELRGAVRRAAGCSPKDYLLGIRLARAKELLAATELPVAAVARRVGYDDPAYFSRLFTRRVGLAPVRFRAQQGRSVPGGWSDRVPDPGDPPMIHSPDTPRGRSGERIGWTPMTTSNTGTGDVDPEVRQELARLRDSIDNIDAAVVHMLAERFKATQQVGRLKAVHQLPPADPAREARQIERLRRLAENAKLDPAFAEKFLNFIIAEVIRHHERIAEDTHGR